MEQTSVEIVEPEHDPYARNAGDKLRLAIATAVFVVTLLLAAVLSNVISGAEDDVIRLTSLVPEPIARMLVSIGAYMGVLAPIALAVAVIYLRRLRVALMVVVAGGLALIAMQVISTALAVNVVLPGDLGQVRFIGYPGPKFLALGAAIVTVLGPWFPRVVRQIGVGTVVLVGFTRIASGANVPYDVLMASVVGWLCGALVVAFAGSPNRHPSGADVVDALGRANLRIRRLEMVGRGVRGSTVYLAESTDGQRRFVKVFSTDQRDADLLLQLVRWIRLRDASEERPFSSLRRAVEHEALLALKSYDEGIPTARFDAVAEVDPEGMLLAFECIDGDPLEGLGPDGVSDEQLRRIWQLVLMLQERRIAHRDLRLAHLLVDDEGVPRLVDFSYSELAAGDALLRTDIAELLCSTAVEVGAERAVAAAIDVLGPDRVADALPRVQPLALTLHTRKAIGAQDGLLDAVQDEVQRCTGLEEVQYEELARIRPRTVVTVVVFAVALYALLPQLADVGEVQEELAKANWAWLLPVVLFQMTTYIGAGMGIVGSVPERVAFLPTMRAQVAAAFVDVLAPASIGGMAMNTRFLQKRGVDPAHAVAGVGVNAIGGFIGHVLLLGGFLLWAGSSSLDAATTSTSDGSSSGPAFPFATMGIVLGIMVALVLLGLLIPPTRRLIRDKLLPTIKSAFAGLAQLARRPRKLVAVIGGSIIVTSGFTGAFVCTVQAFGGGPSVAELGAAYLAAWAVAVFAPTPGGLGALEVALIAALNRLGMSSEAAVSSVLVFRTFTFWIPVAPGWLTFTWLQRHNEI